jgi:hypothetical protein
MLRGVPFDRLRAGFAPKHLYYDVRDPSVIELALRPTGVSQGTLFQGGT